MELFANNAKSTLASGISDTDLALDVAAGEGALYPNPTGGDFFRVTLTADESSHEIIYVTARSTDAFTIERGKEGTTPANWSAGAKVELRATKEMFEAFRAALLPQLEENNPILFDAALSADGKYSGLCIPGTAGATLAFGDLCYLAVADSRWELADADAEATAGGVMLGICVLAAAADGDPTRMLLMGNVRADAAFPTLTIGAPAYVGVTAGDIQVAQPSGTDDVIRVVGHALTADELFFNPSRDWLTHT